MIAVMPCCCPEGGLTGTPNAEDSGRHIVGGRVAPIPADSDSGGASRHPLPGRRGLSLGLLLRVAWQALRRNATRSLLTMLGIIIGVGAVIASMAIGSGAQAAVLA